MLRQRTDGKLLCNVEKGIALPITDTSDDTRRSQDDRVSVRVCVLQSNACVYSESGWMAACGIPPHERARRGLTPREISCVSSRSAPSNTRNFTTSATGVCFTDCNFLDNSILTERVPAADSRLCANYPSDLVGYTSSATSPDKGRQAVGAPLCGLHSEIERVALGEISPDAM